MKTYLPTEMWWVSVSGRTGYQTTPASRKYTTKTGAMGYAKSCRSRGWSARVFLCVPNWEEVAE